MTCLVVGGAGYIGSHVVRELVAGGTPVVVIDNLSSGLAQALPVEVALEVVDACDAAAVGAVMRRYSVTGVIHLAAHKHARESVAAPLKYWRANFGALLGVLEAVDSCPIEWFLLSSSCSVYGSAGEVRSDTPLSPESPYANTKAASELLLQDWARVTGVPWAALRYFNVIGNADFPFAPDRSTECLVPSVVRRIAEGRSPVVFGCDFDTPDGSALRDYLDVRDLARAHALVAQDLKVSEESLTKDRALNASTGAPVSVLEVIQMVSESMRWDGSSEISIRRPGDPDKVWTTPSPELVAIGWTAQFGPHASIASHVNHPDRGAISQA